MEFDRGHVNRVHPNFEKRVKKFMEDYRIKNGIFITFTQATKIIDDKIEKQGGLKPTAV